MMYVVHSVLLFVLLSPVRTASSASNSDPRPTIGRGFLGSVRQDVSACHAFVCAQCVPLDAPSRQEALARFVGTFVSCVPVFSFRRDIVSSEREELQDERTGRARYAVTK